MDSKTAWKRYYENDYLTIKEKFRERFQEYLIDNQSMLNNIHCDCLKRLAKDIGTRVNDINTIEFSVLKSMLIKNKEPHFLVEALSDKKDILYQESLTNIDLMEFLKSLNYKMHNEAKKYILKVPLVLIEQEFMLELNEYLAQIQIIIQQSINNFLVSEHAENLLKVDFIISVGDYRQEQEILYKHEAY